MNNTEKTTKPRRQKRLDSSENDVIPINDFLFSEERQDEKQKKSKFFARLIRANASCFVFSILLYLLQVAPALLMPLITADVIDIITVAIASEMTPTMWYEIGIRIGVLVVLILQNIPSTYFRGIFVSKMLRRTSAGIKCAVVRKLQSLSITYHKDMQTGKVQSKFLKDTESVDTMFNVFMNVLLPSIVMLIFYSVVSVVRNVYVSLFFIIIIPCNVIITFVFRRYIKARNRNFRLSNENMSAQLTTMLELTMVTKAHGLEEKESEIVSNSILKVKDLGHKMDKTISLFGAISWVANVLLQVVCFVFCVLFALKGLISVGEVVLFQTMFTTISNNVLSIINSYPHIATGLEGLSSVSEIMHSKDVEINIGKANVPKVEGNFRFENVSYKYPNTKNYVVKDFDFEVKNGECIAVVGASGSGKSTLMNLIIGLILPTEGNLYIDDKSIKDVNLSEYRHHISVVPQNSILFSGSIKDNITFGLDKYSESQLNRVLEMANVNEFIKDMPDGVNSDVGEHGDKLSGGQKQRITIARALMRNPKILIFDEATSALDNISEYHVQQAIATSTKGRTTFIVAHRLSTIRNADRIVVMEDGRAVEVGTYDELMNKKGKFYELKCLNDVNMKVAEEGLA